MVAAALACLRSMAGSVVASQTMERTRALVQQSLGKLRGTAPVLFEFTGKLNKLTLTKLTRGLVPISRLPAIW